MNDIEIIQEVRERLIKIETMVELQLKDFDSRIRRIEDNQSWLWKSVLGSVIASVLAFYFKK